MNTFVYKGIGIEDESFIRDRVPMTKQEVRMISVCKLKLNTNDVVLDIGAGSGSVSIECAYLAKDVIAIETNAMAVELIHKNIAKFGRTNVNVIEGLAPQQLPNRQVDKVFVGGSKGNLEAIVQWTNGHMASNGIIVANFIVLENAVQFIQLLKTNGYKNIDIVNINVSKATEIGGLSMMKANNPVWIISGEKHEAV